ncbi:uncharacterized protein LOC114755691 [Neltuma alba]|uniref:uncharacterized protein LOC114755691 n=1 Tax=Neltuma alba TaxID=207710 RepID=UPI0010A480D0|nr:uncharacterized protein LOC114755691 [Prosopis alba]
MEHEENIQEAIDDEMLEYLDDSDEADMGYDYFNEFIDVDLVENVGQSNRSYSDEHVGSQVVSFSGVPNENIGDLLSELEDDELYEDHVFDENEDKPITSYDKYNPAEMCKDFKFSLGMEFTSIKQFKDALKEHSLLNGYVFDYVKNDKERCRVKCKSKCGWLMFVSKEADSSTYRLKTLNPKHAWGVTIDATRASTDWIAEKIVDSVRMNKNMKLADVQATIRRNYMAKPSLNKAFWARKKARGMVEGDHKEEYVHLRDYCMEVKSKNPGSTFCLVTDKPYVDWPRVFRRLYMCLEPVKRGFKASCRPIIGLDGCFLKGPYGGILLVAVARDPNEQYFPLAVAVVETENRDSWTWFLKNLFDDIGSIAEKRWGLVQAFEELLEGAEHRYCVRHLYANIKAKYGGGTLVRDLVIHAAKATYPPAWEGIMNELKKVSKEAYEHLMRFNQNRVKAEKYHGKGIVCPRPRKRLDKEIVESRKWEPRFANNDEFEVSYNFQRFTVNLKFKWCACRWWQLTGIPCRHAVSCIYASRLNPIDYVDPTLSLQAYVDCYAPVIHPINGEELWARTRMEPIDPPKYHKRPGRPQKKRRRELDEPAPHNKVL